MTFTDKVTSAVIAGFVSLVIGFITYITNNKNLEQKKNQSEKEMQRKFTEKLYDLRLSVYPKAFEISGKLKSSLLLSEEIKVDQLKLIFEDLVKWHRTNAGFILSRKSIKTWYKLSDALESVSHCNENDVLNDEQIRLIWDAKNRFRSSLREDVNLLYEEEQLSPKGY